ncbi:MAG: hypothetical protein JNL61_14895, partial [Rhizobiaceae bacterium]|nr:hypothetical protein [Rhizobiaceae bacterium]
MTLQGDTITAGSSIAGRISRLTRSSALLDWVIVLALVAIMVVGGLASPQ